MNEETAVAKHATNKQNIDTGPQVAPDWVWPKPTAIYTSLSDEDDVCWVLNAQRITQDLATGRKVSLVGVPERIRNSFQL